ncbi:hypothetical protein BSKO_05289 [Bryopsis sp. KO-2023]|nr:hypothetical protein BSKO_05289 [Bryopsis sp. KO-2023]
MRDEDVAPVILMDRKLGNCENTIRSKTYPKSEFQPAQKVLFESACGSKKPFRYINPHEAKGGVVRKPEEIVNVEGGCYVQALCITFLPLRLLQAFSNMFSPFSADHDDYAEYKYTDESKRLDHGFIPASPSEAKKTIRIKSFMTSADEETLAAERTMIKTKATHMMSDYRTIYRSRRGQRLV